MKHFVVTLCLIALTGCSGLAVRSTEQQSAHPSTPALPSTDATDRLQDGWVQTANESLTLRTGSMVGVATLRDLDAACSRGLMVELIAAPKAAQAALTQTHCISVWRSSAPEVLRSPQVLLVDSYSLVIDGMQHRTTEDGIRQQLRASGFLKRGPSSERLR